ncbi:MAG: GLUG motif-containing protein [Planctomycetota bacterium]
MRKTSLFASLMCVLLSTCALAVGGDMGGADPNGSAEKPYLIKDINDFDVFASDPNYWAAGVHTKLMTNIDLAGRTYITAVIAPDGGGSSGVFQGTPFSGNFDGNGFIVKNLSINGTRYCGLFGKINTGSEVKNLGTKNVFIIGTLYYYIGGLVGQNYYGSIMNSYSTGTVNGGSAGGLVGENWSGTITSCHSSGAVVASGTYSAGGLVCSNYGGIIDSYSTCTVDGYTAGGLVGSNSPRGVGGPNDGRIASCYSTGAVTASYEVGGLAGSNQGSITDCYSTGSVNGGSFVGGLIGSTWGGIIVNSYSTGSVNGDLPVGGLIGENLISSVTNCFWDTDTSGQTTSHGGTGKTTAQMMTQSTFTGWDFVNDWMMLREGEDYPRLAWQEVFEGDIAGLYGADMVDFAYLAGYWGLTGCNTGTDCGRADIDGSGDVWLPDLAAVAEDWLR